jgi:hypothetical protein
MERHRERGGAGRRKYNSYLAAEPKHHINNCVLWDKRDILGHENNFLSMSSFLFWSFLCLVLRHHAVCRCEVDKFFSVYFSTFFFTFNTIYQLLLTNCFFDSAFFDAM